MSPRRRKDKGQGPGEGLAEGTISPSAELEEALREASESVGGEPAPAEEDARLVGKLPVDEMTIEALSLEVETLREEVEARQVVEAELEDRLLRQRAEFENFRRRGVRDREEAHRFGHQNLVKDLLVTVDNLERAVEHVDDGDGGSLEGIVEGVAIVYRELLAALAKYGVSSVEALRERFDPNIHEAVGQIPSEDGSSNTVVEVLEKGYRIHDRLIRPARVVISVAAGGQTGEEEG